jgi:hypothetical protein
LPDDIVTTLSKLPATPAITYRGAAGPDPSATITLAEVMSTSLDPRIASENFTSERLAAIVSITGRLISPLARHPEDQEIAMLPGTQLVFVGSVDVPGLPNSVLLLSEPGSAPGLPPDLESLKNTVAQQVTSALARPEVQVSSPGRFSPRRSNDSRFRERNTSQLAIRETKMEPLDNAIVRRAVVSFAAQPNQANALEVLRSCMFGNLLLDTTGSDAPATGFVEGSRLQIRHGSGPDGKPALFAFTRNEEVARLYPRGTTTTTMVNPATGVLEFAKSQNVAWLYIDPAGPTCAVSAAEIGFALRNPRNEPLKTATVDLAFGRVDRQRVVELLKQDGPLLLGVDDSSQPGKVGFRNTAMPDGSAGLFVFTSAPEVVAHNVTDAVMASTTAKVIEIARQDGYGALIINPSGPYVAVSLGELDS